METSAILGYIFGAILTLVNGLILFNLKKLSSEIEETKTEIKNSNRRIEILEQRKSDCQRDFVSAEAWVRDSAYTRQKLDQLLESVASLTGSLKVIEQMPQICGQIAREAVQQTIKAMRDK